MYRTSRPMMAPLLFDYQHDELTYRISDQYLFGHDMMICPVTNKGALSRPVYFPGEKWVDFWTGERIEGRQWKSFLTPPDLMPIFIKAGAIIPQQPAMQYTKEKPVTEISLLVYPSGTSSYLLYDDDGVSLDYQKGIYAQTLIESVEENGSWKLMIHATEGKYKPVTRTYQVKAYWDGEAPQQVMVNSKPIKEWKYDATLRQLLISPSLNNLKDIIIEVR